MIVKTAAVVSCFAALLSLAGPAAAHDDASHGDHDHPPALAATGKVTLALHGGIAFAPSLGGEYEDCSKATCTSRTRALAPVIGGKVGYELASGLAFEVDLSILTSSTMKVARNATLVGEQSLAVPVQIEDQVTFGGPMLVGGVSYAIIKAPIVLTPAIGIGAWFAKYETERSGTITTDAQPSPRSMRSAQLTDLSATHIVAVPELRAALPIGDRFQIGLSLAAIIVFDGEVRPKVTQAADPSPNDPSSKPTYNGRTIGFIPQTNATPESAVEGPFVFLRPTAFAKVSF